MGNTKSSNATVVPEQIAIRHGLDVIVEKLKLLNALMVSAERNVYKARDNMEAANKALSVAKENQKDAAQRKASVMMERYKDANTTLEKVRSEHSAVLNLGVTMSLEADKLRNAAGGSVYSLNG